MSDRESLETPCDSAMRTNDHSLSDSERTPIKRRCIEMVNQLSVLGSEIAQLVSKHESHTKSYAILHSTISPIGRLPTELLSRIFTHIMDSLGAPEIVLPPSDKLPWGLGRVCSRWRLVLYGQPGLWQNVNFILRDHTASHGPQVDRSIYLQRVREILPRGLTCLELSLLDCSANEIDSMLVQLVHFRLKRLHLFIDLQTLIKCLRSVPQSFASLEDVALNMRSSVMKEEDMEHLQANDLFLIASRVTKLLLGHVLGINYQPQLLQLPHIPWSQIICLSLDTSYSEDTHIDFVKILAKTPMLQDLTCQFDFDLYFLDDEDSPPSNPLTCYDSLPIVDLPYLVRLKITARSLNMAYLPFPWTQLRSLSFTFISDIRTIKAILRHTPHLESLSVKDGYLSNGLISEDPIKMNTLGLVEITWEMAQLLNHITTPHLDRLQIYASDTSSHQYVDSLPRFIGDLITRSSPPRFSLSYLADSECRFVGRANDYDPDDFLKPMTHLYEFQAYPGPLIFPDDIVADIGCSSLFPKLQLLEVRIKSPIIFANAVERRVKTGLEEGFIRLKKAHGYYDGTFINENSVGVSDAFQRLKVFNQREFGGVLEEVRNKPPSHRARITIFAFREFVARRPGRAGLLRTTARAKAHHYFRSFESHGGSGKAYSQH
ncbi:hypothetical protein H0H92_015993 [Tricholoma furcatifolium]|nr:hypothetical protein H0H92_015993 [Tricholoma furcatifolium]